MNFRIAKLASSAFIFAILTAPAAQAQDAAPAAPEGLPLFVWLNSLVDDDAPAAKSGEVTVSTLGELKSDTKLAATGYKRKKRNMKHWVSKPKTPKTPAVAKPVVIPQVSAPVVAATPPVKPSTISKVAAVSTTLKTGSAAPRVYSIEDIFGTADTAKTPGAAPKKKSIQVASVATTNRSAAKPKTRTKKRANMKTWKSHAKKSAAVRAPVVAGMDPKFVRKSVTYKTKYAKGTIVVDTTARYLYLIGEDGNALRYGIGVGRQGFTWKGEAKIQRKAKWPAWHPPASMRKREPWLPVKMEGGPENPLGARALYLYKGGKDTLYRIHGTDKPSTIGKAVSSGCIRLVNDDISDLYSRTPRGTTVVVL